MQNKATPNAQDICVLVVDDDNMVRELEALCLERVGFQVRKASDGTGAVKEVESGGVDVVVVDLMMPVMDGIHFLEWLRTEAESDIPVMVLTAAVEQQIERRVREAGANMIAYKPLNAEEIVRRVFALYEERTKPGDLPAACDEPG